MITDLRARLTALKAELKDQSAYPLDTDLSQPVPVGEDDNEYYSEYDFPDDSIFHSGIGQLGQPSLIYEALIELDNDEQYFLLFRLGYGHHSAQDGELYPDLSGMTTAQDILERVLVRVEGRVTVQF